MTRPGRIERTLIAVTGHDARPFLQNLLTQDLDRLDDAGVVYAALLSPQGKVGADMFGMVLRAYQRKLQRLRETVEQRDRSLWQAVLDHIAEHGVVSRAELLRRFKREEPAVMRGVLRDLVDSDDADKDLF